MPKHQKSTYNVESTAVSRWKSKETSAIDSLENVQQKKSLAIVEYLEEHHDVCRLNGIGIIFSYSATVICTVLSHGRKGSYTYIKNQWAACTVERASPPLHAVRNSCTILQIMMLVIIDVMICENDIILLSLDLFYRFSYNDFPAQTFHYMRGIAINEL